MYVMNESKFSESKAFSSLRNLQNLFSSIYLVKISTVGTCSLVQGNPTGVCSDVNRVLARDGNSSVDLASQGHCAGVFIGI